MRQRINASPDKYWKIPLEAPDLPETFFPQAKLFGAICPSFDMGLHPHGWNRNKDAAHPKGDPFHGERELSIPRGGLHGEKQRTDAARGNEESEAALQYEYHASLRMMAKREGKVEKGKHVTEEDRPETASAAYTAWRHRKIQAGLAGNVGTYATDHSTILTNSEHSRKALAYDVAVGCCHLLETDLRELRMMADWRFLEYFESDEDFILLDRYIKKGKYKEVAVLEWSKSAEGSMPEKIKNLRENS
ncbi:effector protein Tle3 domain-containing protein [Janthinobacterium svalbardensis]|uniref:effector protein Tle3 domain-containing protein n=1 Tax=Janthinobacterium svalbardensis TaxID=368607 RepID=UPI002FCD7E5C